MKMITKVCFACNSIDELDKDIITYNNKRLCKLCNNTSNYYTGMNANTVNGNNDILNYGNGFSSKSCSNGSPVFLQKDFDGVANIFAPNIIIQNPPLTSDGYPDISYRM